MTNEKKMRRSSQINILLASGISLTLLSGCGESPKEQSAKIFKNVQECVADAEKAAQDENKGAALTQDQRTAAMDGCKTAYDQTTKAQAQAPAYSQKAQCEQEYGSGHCETRVNSDGSSSFAPMMMGFMMGQAMSGGSPRYYSDDDSYYRRYGRHHYVVTSSPVYVNTHGDMYAGRTNIGSATRTSSGWSAPHEVAVARTSTGGFARASSVASRGGFGSSASHFGGVSS